MKKETAANNQHSFEEASANDELRSLQLIRAGSDHFGIFADEIAAIVDWREPTPLPYAPKPVLGVVSIQGRMLTVLEFTTLACGDTAMVELSNGNQRRIIALRGDEQLALAVDAVDEIVSIAYRDLKPKRERAGTLVLGILQVENAEINILNVKELFTSAIQGRERRRRRF
jgi:purine-binding chemotaxis protein CheW